LVLFLLPPFFFADFVLWLSSSLFFFRLNLWKIVCCLLLLDEVEVALLAPNSWQIFIFSKKKHLPFYILNANHSSQNFFVERKNKTSWVFFWLLDLSEFYELESMCFPFFLPILWTAFVTFVWDELIVNRSFELSP
jgi:hypothetical protein